MSRFNVVVCTQIEIEIDDAILALHADAEWVRSFYDLDTPEQIAEHLAWNVGLHDRPLSSLDGFADRDDADCTARVVDVDYDTAAVPA